MLRISRNLCTKLHSISHIRTVNVLPQSNFLLTIPHHSFSSIRRSTYSIKEPKTEAVSPPKPEKPVHPRVEDVMIKAVLDEGYKKKRRWNFMGKLTILGCLSGLVLSYWCMPFIRDIIYAIIHDDADEDMEVLWDLLFEVCLSQTHGRLIDISSNKLIKMDIIQAIKKTLKDENSYSTKSAWYALHAMNVVVSNRNSAYVLAQDKELLLLLKNAITRPSSSEFPAIFLKGLQVWRNLLSHQDERIMNILDNKEVGLEASFLWDTAAFAWDNLYGPLGLQISAQSMQIISYMASHERLSKWSNGSKSVFLDQMLEETERTREKLKDVVHDINLIYSDKIVLLESASMHNLVTWVRYNEDVNNDMIRYKKEKKMNPNEIFEWRGMSTRSNQISFLYEYKYPSMVDNLEFFSYFAIVSTFALFGITRSTIAVGRYLFQARKASPTKIYPLLIDNPWLRGVNIKANKLRVLTYIALRTTIAASILALLDYDAGKYKYALSANENGDLDMIEDIINIILRYIPIYYLYSFNPYMPIPVFMFRRIMDSLNDPTSATVIAL